MKYDGKTENRILNAALKLFVHKGFHGTSIKDIMAIVGLTKGAFYSHFESKGDLFLKIVEVYRLRFFDGMVATANEFEGNAIEKLNRIFNFLSKFGSENIDLCFFLTFLSPELNADEDFEPALRQIYVDYQNFISGLIQQGIDQGLFKQDLNPDLIALAFMALHDGALNQWWRLKKYIDGEEYAHTFRNLFLSGLGLTTHLNDN